MSLAAELERLAGKLPPEKLVAPTREGGILGALLLYLEHGPAILSAAVEKESEALGSAAGRVQAVIVAHAQQLVKDTEAAAVKVEPEIGKSYDDLMAELAQLRTAAGQSTAAAVQPGDAAAEAASGQAPPPAQTGVAEQPGVAPPFTGVTA